MHMNIIHLHPIISLLYRKHTFAMDDLNDNNYNENIFESLK